MNLESIVLSERNQLPKTTKSGWSLSLKEKTLGEGRL